MRLTKIGDFIKRSKIPIDILDNEDYSRVTIRINHNGVSLRDTETGKSIGTKKQFILKSGQFIVSKIDARYGAFGIAPDEVDGAIITGNFWAYDVEKSKVDIDWFNQFTNSPVFYEVCERASSGITHRKYLDEKFFLGYEILLPGLKEQQLQIKSIQEQKSSFGELSTELTHQLSLVKKLRQQLLHDAVQGKLVKQNLKDEPASELLKKIKAEKEKLVEGKKIKKDKGVPPVQPAEIPFEIPENWAWCRLGELFEIVRGSSPRPKGDPRFWSKDRTNFHWITIADFTPYGINGNLFDTKGFLTELGSQKSRVVKKGDLLVACSGVGSVGRSIETNIDGFIYDGLLAIRNISNESLKEFAKHFLKYKEEQIYSVASGANWLNINIEILSNYIFPLPPLPEQNRIIQKLDELMQYCDNLEASIKTSAAQNEKLVQQVLREALRKG